MASRRESRRAVHDRQEEELEFGRVLAFTDGVFAIAITLLVLALDVPPNLDDVGQALRDRSSDFVAYGISFAVLGSIWLAHHRFYTLVARYDGRLIVLNLLYLALVALVPFSAELLGHYSDTTDGVIVYALNLAGISLSFTAQIFWAFHKGLVKDEVLAQRRRYIGPSSFVVSGTFLLSIPVAFIDPSLCPIIWVALLVLGGRLIDAVADRQAR
jgi:TMEM175 potassium channel family protein